MRIALQLEGAIVAVRREKGRLGLDEPVVGKRAVFQMIHAFFLVFLLGGGRLGQFRVGGLHII